MSATLLSAWETTWRAAPAAVAVLDASGGACTRAELQRAAAERQAGLGLAPGETVMVCESNGADWLVTFLALLQAGAVVAPLDPGEPPEAQRATARAIGAGFLWTGGQLEAIGRGRRMRGARLIKLTSGSTGAPRALRFTDAQMLADGAQVCAGMAIRPDDVSFAQIPFGHSYGLGNLVMPLLQQGTTVACGGIPLPHAMADAIARARATVFPAVPALLRALADASVEPAALRTVRTVISAGAPLAPEVAQAFAAKFGRNIHSFYGSSETGGITYDPTGEAALTGRSVGAPLPGVQVDVGRSGRFTVESAAVYTLGNPHRGTSGRGVHRPSDLGAWTDGGELMLRGRTGRAVKIAGRRLDLAEVEHAFRAVPGVRDAWVTLHAGRAEALAAAVATDLGGEALRDLLRPQLAGWKIPKRIVTLPAFPLTARGKVDTRALAGLVARGGG